MTKIKVAAQAPYPVAITSGRHLAPGESAVINRTSDIEDLLMSGSLREIPVEEAPEKEQRKPRVEKARDENQED